MLIGVFEPAYHCSIMATSKEVKPTSTQKKLLDMDLPDDDEIKEAKRERYTNTVQDETDSDSDTSDDSDIEDSMEKYIWDGLFPTGKPYTNSLEDLKKILASLPTRFSERQRKIKSDLKEDEKSHHQMKKIIQMRLVGEDIDQDILMENLERVRNIVKKKIKKRERIMADKINVAKSEVRECVVLLERMNIDVSK
ncbi:uncharacterized protein isoform X1 [Choristoneura fumiferana]|uniref:uncharacterized protein isoform X1 n=2 Tax=Choristoneura fumiferana TaxID=7141 RepID=UPI003D1586A5